MNRNQHYRARIKMCGIKTPKDAVYAASLGVDAIGLVFYEKSPRNISIVEAKAIVDALPAFVTVVGLFYNASAEQVDKTLSSVALDCLQFHGVETPEFCTSFDKPYIKAIPMLSDIDLSNYIQAYPTASGYMLDAMASDQAGGTGKTFDWSLIPEGLQKNIILAGGLTPQNVAEAITKTQCYAVDVSSGIESSRGVKDKEKMAAFAKEVNRINKVINEK